MSKEEQLENVYSHFVKVNSNYVFLFYKPNNEVLVFKRNGILLDVKSRERIEHSFLLSFRMCKYNHGRRLPESKKLADRFIKTLQKIDFSDIKKLVDKD
ncbi:hypothetical protein K7G92_000770 [Pasteurella canis]|uniref:hypothetical protein n=1 Tax=Pasteurella canis TaxID=753 RepID=UPI001E424DD7|nr:hypothetical protein [Pasteurella canis]UEA17559.1 hypothetical protein K7G92_000770 [Pasteurella canis]